MDRFSGTEPTEFRDQVREALYHLYDSEKLQELALTTWLRMIHTDTTAHRLSTYLIDSIDQLKPPPNTPPNTPNWRSYTILFCRFIQCMTIHEVANQLGIGERHVRRHQAQAIDYLANVLWDKYMKSLERQRTDCSGHEQDGAQKSIESNLAWLHDEQTLQQADVGTVMLGVEGLLASLLAANQASLQFALPKDFLRARIHPLALRQIMLNVLSTAVESARGGEIRVTITNEEGTWVRIRVENCNSRAQYASLRMESLATSIELLEICQGRLSVDDEHKQEVCIDLWIPAARRLPVLIVEDNTDTAQLFSRYLNDSRFRPITAQGGREAMTLVPKVRPSAIILDVMMPDQDGWELLILFKTHPLTERVPIIMATILTDRELALSLGASEFLHKPVRREQLIGALERVTT